MTNEELNANLYERLFAEQKSQLKRILTMQPSEIMDHAEEYIMGEDILYVVDDNVLSNLQCMALLLSDTPMKDIREKIMFSDEIYLDAIREAAEGNIQALLEKNTIKKG